MKTLRVDIDERAHKTIFDIIKKNNYCVSTGKNNLFELIAYHWTTEPPAEPGWYWAIREGGDPQCVEVVSDYYGDGSVPFMAIETGNDYASDLDLFTHWLGPLPIPELPK